LSTDQPAAFFCYAREDSEFALRLADDLKRAGAAVWIDQLDIKPGQRWAHAVQDALSNAQRVLVVLSPASVASTNVDDEVTFALDEQKTVIPVFYQDCKVPFRLRALHYVDLRVDYAKGLKLLLEALDVKPAPASRDEKEWIGFDMSGPPGAQAQRKQREAEDAWQAQAIYQQIAVDAARDKPQQERTAAELRKRLFQATAAAHVPPGMENIQAGFEELLKPLPSLSLRELRTLTGHTGYISGVALSGEVGIAVSASGDRTLKVWDLGSGRELRTLNEHSGSVRDVALTTDGRIAVSASDDHMVKVWEVESGRELRILAGHTDDVRHVALSADGRIAVSASRDKTLKVWEAGSGRKMRTLVSHTGYISGVALSGDGRIIVSGTDNRGVKVWDVGSGQELRTLVGHTDTVYALAISRDGRITVSGSRDRTLKVWDVDSGRELRALVGHSDLVNGVAISGDGRIAVSASSDQTLRVWDLNSGQELVRFHSDVPLYCCALSLDGKIVVAGGTSGVLHCLALE
jgi:hypothetical protein